MLQSQSCEHLCDCFACVINYQGGSPHGSTHTVLHRFKSGAFTRPRNNVATVVLKTCSFSLAVLDGEDQLGSVRRARGTEGQRPRPTEGELTNT